MRRRRQPQIAFVCAVTCLLLCACTDGKGTPLRLADGVDGGEDSEAGSGGTTTSNAGHSGMRSIDASEDVDDEPVLNSKCRSKDATWLAANAADERRLLEALNELRADPNGFCPPFPLLSPELEMNPALQCAARMRFDEMGAPRSSGGPPSYSAYLTNQRSQDQTFRDREKKADATRIDAEIAFVNMSASSVDSVVTALESSGDPSKFGSFCYALTQNSLAGIARSGNVWVVDLGRGSQSSTRPPSGTGPSGPGNSGTGGR
jgi:hypothetical protein